LLASPVLQVALFFIR